MKESERLVELMEEMVELQKLMAMPTIKKLIGETLDKPEKMYVYEMTDGITTRDKITVETGASGGAISSWWNEWFSKGLLKKEGAKYKRILSLKDLGMSLPMLKRRIKNDVEVTNKELNKNSGAGVKNE